MNDVRGSVMIMCAAAFWGISATAAKILLNQEVDTLLIVQCRVTFSFLILFLFYVILKPQYLRVDPKEVWQFALLGILGVAGANFTYYFAIKEGAVAPAILVQYTAPLAVMGYATLMKSEQLTLTKVVAATLSLLGCFLAVGALDTGALNISPIGLASAIGSMLTFAFLNLYTRHLLQRYSVWTLSLYSFLFASLFWLVLHPPGEVAAQGISAETWLALILLAIISVLIPHTLFFAGLQYVLPTRAIITSTLEPIVAIVSAALILGEYLSFIQTLGAILVISAVVLLQIPKDPESVGGAQRSVSTMTDAH
jgi:drug/metabolite transporter (DMT)-like permease